MGKRKGGTGRSGKDHRFGGSWTDAKLRVLADYMAAYTTALKNQRFRKWYVDAFAGTGYRTVADQDASGAAILFPELAAPEPQELLDGSARKALKTEPRFDRYVFVERDIGRCAALEKLKDAFPDLASAIDVRQGDANEQIRDLCASVNWKSTRAVLFLDPYGMQVEWATIDAIAQTHAIDMWLLFPLGIGLARLLPGSGQVPQGWRRRIDLILGKTDWYDDFYRVEPAVQQDFFDDPQPRLERVAVDKIGRYFNERLMTVFTKVVDEPGVLRNSTNKPLYLLCFAAGNEKGAPIACRIAKDLLKGLR